MKHRSHRLAFLAYCLAITAGLGLLAEFVLLPHLAGLPREALLMRFAAPPGTVVDGQTINSMGFTADTVDHPKPAGTLRILVLGSSTMFNRHLGERLKAALQAHSQQPIELLDAGLRSHTSRSDLLKFRWLRQYHFDYLIYYNGINDLWANHIEPSQYREDYSHLGAWYAEGPWVNHSLLARDSYVLLRPWLEKLTALTGHGEPSSTDFLFPKKSRQNLARFASVTTYQHNLESILALARDSKTTVLLSTFAYTIPPGYTRRAFLENRLGYVNPDQYDRRDVFNWGEPGYVREGLDRINAVTRALAAAQDIPLLDSDAALSGNLALFGDPCHFNDDGVDRFIGLVVQAFTQRGWITPPPGQ